MSIETALAELTAAVVANTAILEKLEAGREAAIAQLEQKSDKAPRASRKKADEPAAAGNGANADTGSAAGAAEPASNPAPVGVTEDDVRATATSYIKGAGENVEERKARAGNIKSITDHFGVSALAGDAGIKDPEQRAQAVFYLNRFAAGQPVDFSAEYDFAGDPGQDASPGVDDSMDGIG